MTDISAVIGIEQLKNLERLNKKRVFNARHLSKSLSQVKGIVVPHEYEDRTHVFHQYTIRIINGYPLTRDGLIARLKAKGIGYGIYYPLLIPEQKPFKKILEKTNLPVASKVCKEVLSIPVHPFVKRDELGAIIDAIANV